MTDAQFEVMHDDLGEVAIKIDELIAKRLDRDMPGSVQWSCLYNEVFGICECIALLGRYSLDVMLDYEEKATDTIIESRKRGF